MNLPLYSIATTLAVIGGAVFVGLISEILREVCTVIVAHQTMEPSGKIIDHFNLFKDEEA